MDGGMLAHAWPRMAASRPHERSSFGGRTGIRTQERVAPLAVFSTAARGGGGIRTHGRLPPSSFQDCHLRPLGHPSWETRIA